LSQCSDIHKAVTYIAVNIDKIATYKAVNIHIT